MTTAAYGVRISGTGSAVPDRVLTNADLEKILDTSDDWIVQRTGIHERRIVDASKKEGTFSLSRDALKRALDDAGMKASELDLIINASVSAEMTCPSNACRISNELGAAPAGAFDLVAACSGFVYALNVAESMIQSGRYRNIGIIGCDAMSTIVDYEDRSVSILFGDAAGSAILTRDEDKSIGCLYQSLQADGAMWESLYLPRKPQDVPEIDCENPIKLGCLRMNGREVYRFAVTKFREVIEDALQQTGLTIDEVSQFVCHQSNVRIINAAKEKIGLPDDKVHVNIDKYGNSSAGSVGLCFDELRRAGKIKSGDTVVFVAFGGGLTWASSVWRL